MPNNSTVADEPRREIAKPSTPELALTTPSPEITEPASPESAEPSAPRAQTRHVLVACGGALLIAIAAMLLLRASGQKENTAAASPAAEAETITNEVTLAPEASASSQIEIVGVTVRQAVAPLRVTGTVEANQERTQQVTPLIGGRVERIHVVLGDRVGAGSVLAVIASPQIAQMHGKMHEAETQLSIAERNYKRVQLAENRVAVLQAQARLDEAEATLKRTRRIVELGAGAGKDLVAAETTYRTAKAEYDFQTNVSLNREVQEAQAAVETARVDVRHIRDELRALGAPVAAGEHDDHQSDTSLVTLLAPASGIVTERMVNAGAGLEAGKPLFTIADTSIVWVIASVPEAQTNLLRTGMPAEITTSATGDAKITGRVSYIAPKLNADTRTAQVRIEVPNKGDMLRVGMFVEVGLQGGASSVEELVIPADAVQRVGGRSIVFVSKENAPGRFEAREVQLGDESEGFRRITNGLGLHDRVVSKGSFILKSLLMKRQLSEEE